MNVLILADAEFARREMALLARLETGLAAEGARVLRAIPKRCIREHDPHMAAQLVPYEDQGLGITRPLRAAQLLVAIEKILVESRTPSTLPDVIHVFGGPAWAIGREVARRAGAGLALEVWCSALVARAAALRFGADRTDRLLLAPDPAIERALFKNGAGTSVRVTPWGVHVPPEPRMLLAQDRAAGIVIAGAGADREGFAAAIEGIASVVASHPDLLVFVDADAARAAQVWPRLRRLGLGDRASLIPRMESGRELILSADILMVPEGVGEHRSLLLDAMAAGLAVVAHADPLVSHLVDRRTARLVAGADPGLWAETLRELLDDPAGARALGASAREYVREFHRASNFVGQVLDAYEWLAAREALPLRSSTDTRAV